jgi:hypothetical protein
MSQWYGSEDPDPYQNSMDPQNSFQKLFLNRMRERYVKQATGI